MGSLLRIWVGGHWSSLYHSFSLTYIYIYIYMFLIKLIRITQNLYTYTCSYWWLTIELLCVCRIPFRTVLTTGHQGTMMDATGWCGSFPCLDAPIPLRCWGRLRRSRSNTPRPMSESLDSTTSVKCSASVSLLTRLLASKMFNIIL